MLEHPAYVSDLASSGYLRCPAIKQYPVGHRSENGCEMENGKWKLWRGLTTKESGWYQQRMQKLVLQRDWQNALVELQIVIKWWDRSAIRHELLLVQLKIQSSNYLHCKCIFWPIPTPSPHEPILHHSACRHSMVINSGQLILLLQIHTQGQLYLSCNYTQGQRIFLL